MALPTSGNSISFGQINDELDNTTTDTLDLENAAENGFGLSKPHGLNEMFGLSLSRLQLTVKFLKENDDNGDDTFTGWFSDASLAGSTKGELVLCAEGVIVPEDGRGNSFTTLIQQDTSEFNSDSNVSNGDTIFEASSGTTLTDVRPGGDLTNQETFLVETTQDNIFQINSSGVLSNVRSRTPNTPAQPSMTSRDADSITVNVTADTSVTRQLIPVQDGSDLTAILPSDSGSIGDTSITTSYTFSGLDAGTTYALGFKGKNAFATTSVGTTLSQATTAAETSLASSPTTTNAFADSNSTTVGSQVGGLLTVTITNRNGNSTIGRTVNTSGQMTIAVSTSGDPGTNGTGNSGSGFLASHSGLNSDTLYIRPKFTEGGRNVTEGPTTNVITVTNNSVALNINVVCRSTNLG